MIKSSRTCQIKDHQDYNSTHICTFQGCNLGNRWVCGQCFAEQIHQHNQTSITHIMNKQQFQMLLNQLLNNDNKNNKNLQVEIQLYIQQIMQLLQVISQFELYLQKCLNEIDDYKSSLSIQNQLNHDWFSLNNDQIAQILNKQNNKQYQFNNSELLISVQQITKQLQEIEQSIFKNSQQKEQISKKNSYEFEDYVKLKLNDLIQTAQISGDEQYLAYGGREKLCVIFDLSLNKEIISIKLDYVVSICQFSNDSQLLYIGCSEGQLYCIDIANNCQQIYQQQINQTNIYNIKEIQHQVIISSQKTEIIITNIKQKQQILKIHNAHTDWIYGLDYNKLNDVIVSGSIDRSIKFFDGQSGKLLFEKQQSHDHWIEKIQLINDNRLASLSGYGILKYWQVDYQKKELILLNQHNDVNKICDFQFINYQQIMIICKKYFQILDHNFKVVKQIEHSQNDDVWFRRTNQLNSMNYVIISGEKQFTVMRRLQRILSPNKVL